MIDKQLAYDIISTGLTGGADFVEIFTEHNEKTTISLINGRVDKALAGIDHGLGLRLFFGERVIYAYTNDLTRDSLLKITKDSCINGRAIKTGAVLDLSVYDYTKNNRHMVKIYPENVSKREIVDLLNTAHTSAAGYSLLITQTGIGYSSSNQQVEIINSKGVWAKDNRVRTRVSISAVASNDTEKQTGYFGPGALSGFEFMESTDLEHIGREAARSAITMLKADNCPSGKMPVVMDNGFGGVIFHEACGHGLEAAAVSKNASVFANKLNQQIASTKVTAVDDGTIANSWGSINVDDEGNKAEKKILIENGVLKNYMVDIYNGMKMGMTPNGSGRRESYKYMPTSRMTNTYIAAGTDKAEDIISSVDYGLYAKYMGGGSVNPATGEFNFAVNEAYLIRNGKVCEPVRGATLIGKGSQVLMDIDMVSDNLALAEGMCGASSGSVPVCVGQPMLRVKEMVVGGRG